MRARFALALAIPVLLSASGRHDGPDPVWHWICTGSKIQGDTLGARFGPAATLFGAPEIRKENQGECLYLDGQDDRIVVAADLDTVRDQLPRRHLTVSAWLSVETPKPWGGVLSVVADDGDAERGFVLGYDQRVFTFGLASVGADDGDGRMTYVKGKTDYEVGRLYHVVGTYDGEVQRLFVNGKLEAESREQRGDILYPDHTPVVLGGYRDSNEDFPHHGRLREVALYDLCARPKWIAEEFAHDAALADLPAVRSWPDELEFVVPPYLQFVTQDGITVMCETSRPSTLTVRHGETGAVERAARTEAPRTLHEIRLTDLPIESPWFYQVAARDDRGQEIESPVLTFQTAVREDTPFGFAVISDTQDNPAVSGRIAAHAFGQRPNFLLIPGDLVGAGTQKTDWTHEFFPSMGDLVARVAFFPVLGNHEQDARHYYDYVSVPAPEHRYTFRYGNAQFFVVDTNRDVSEGSEQHTWLAQELAASTATWKFATHHHPAYSSDENDYGDMWTGKSTHGDLRVRALTALYDAHDVDIVFNGHIHSYERTWPVHAGKVVRDGTIYMITGGGGGGLETPGPIKPWFQNNVRRGHHYCTVSIAGRVLELKTFDLENRLFDLLKIEK
jgi:predicted phosphodiesterase